MTTADIERAAEAAYKAYNAGRMPLPWSLLAGHEKHRWTRLVRVQERFVRIYGVSMSPATMRRAYYEGYAPWSWENVAPRFKRRWSDVYTALITFSVAEAEAA